MGEHELEFWYVNHRGEGEQRRVRPMNIFYGATQYYHEPCWMLSAWDETRGGMRDFRLDKLNVR